MKLLFGELGFLLGGFSPAVMQLENARDDALADMQYAAARHNFRIECHNIKYLMDRLIAAHDAAETDPALRIGGFKNVE